MTPDEYYAAREQQILTQILDNEGLDYEDIDYIFNNFELICENIFVYAPLGRKPRFYIIPTEKSMSGKYYPQKVELTLRPNCYGFC